ncbi:MAG TPA: VanW family protein [Candidatus Bathyarchaeia archaeon]|nr:VanW family protein [Candidatus Bathyarchaeia archaeon]
MKKKLKSYWRYSLFFPAVVLVLALIVFASYQLIYQGKIYPGITLIGQPIGNLSRQEANKIIETLIKALRNKHKGLLLTADQQSWTIGWNDLKLEYQTDESIKKAYLFGRTGNIWQNTRQKIAAAKNGINLQLEYSFDKDYLDEKVASLAAELYIPAVEPSIEVVKEASQTSRIVIHPGEPGKQLNTRLLFSLLMEKLEKLDANPVSLPLLTISPSLIEEEVTRITKQAEKLLGERLTLVWENKSWSLEEEELVNFLFSSNGFDRFKISEYVGQLAASIDQTPEDAAFQFENGRVVEFRPAKNGQRLNQLATVEMIVNSLNELAGDQTLTLPVVSTEPMITTADANNLGIREMIGRGESWFKGSIASRIHNIKLASSRLNGILIKPQEAFSFNQSLGEVSETTGYQKAYIIRSGRTVLGDGGGVCQVSTTLFRAALNAGLPIIERHAHAYRVSYYEQNSQVGLDATVYDPTANLVFENDLPTHLLVQTKVDLKAQKLTFELYGTPDGRKAEIGKTRIWGQTSPPPALYQDDPNLPVGTTKQIDWPAWGAKAAFDWKVTRDGQVLQERTFYSNYRPWQAIYLVGTKPD